MAGELLTPGVVSAVKAAGPEVIEAVGLDVVGIGVTAAARVEAGLNPVADIATPIADTAAATKDAEATAKVVELGKAILESPAGKSALKATDQTAEQFLKKLEAEGPKAIKELLDTKGASSLKADLQAVVKSVGDAWEHMPGAAKAAIGAVGGMIGTVASGIGNSTIGKDLTGFVSDAYNDRFHHPQIAPEGSDRFQDLAKPGISGRVVGQDGVNVTLQVGRDRFSVTNLSSDQLKDLKSGEMVSIRPTEHGRVQVQELAVAGQPLQQQAHGTQTQGRH